MFLDTIFDPVHDIEWVVSISRVVRDDWHDPLGQQKVVPVEDVVSTVSKYSDRRIDGERVTRDAHRRLSRCLFGPCELCRYRNLCAGRDDRTTESVVVLLSCWIVVPRRRIVVLNRFNVGRIDGTRRVNQATGGGLLDEPGKDIVEYVFEVGEKSVNRVP